MYIVHVTSALTSFQYLQGNNLLNIAERNYIFWSPCPHVCRRHTFFISQILRTTSNDHQRITNSPPPFCSAHVDRDIKAKNQALPSLYLKVSSFDRLEMIEMSIQYSLEELPHPLLRCQKPALIISSQSISHLLQPQTPACLQCPPTLPELNTIIISLDQNPLFVSASLAPLTPLAKWPK